MIDDFSEERPRKFVPIVVEYVFAVHGQTKPPEIRGSRFRIGDVVYSTTFTPVRYRVVEVYWLKASKARVLLREERELTKPVRKPQKRFSGRPR